MKNRQWKRILSAVMALSMVLSSVPVGVFAESADNPAISFTSNVPGAEVSVPSLPMSEAEGAPDNPEEAGFYPLDDPDQEPDGEESALDYVSNSRTDRDTVTLLESKMYATLSGKVVDAEGNGLPNINVTLYDNSYEQILASCYTDSNGNWSSDAAVVGNEYHLRFHSPYYSFPMEGLIVLAAGESVAVDTVTGTETFATDAEAAPGTDFAYKALNATYISIIGYLGDATQVVIPEKIDGYIVQSIGTSAFSGNETLERVILPFSLTTIESSAFHGCTALSYVGFNDELTTIGSSAFYGCTSLQTIDLPNSVLEIHNHAFYQCTALQNITMPMTLVGIYGYAFAGCTALEHLSIPNSVVGIGYRAFYQDTALKEVALPTEWVKCLAYNVNGYNQHGQIFEGCTQLTSIIVPESIVTLPAYAFAGCESLKTISLPSTLQTVGNYAFRDCIGLTEFGLSSGVTKVGDYAFDGCTELEDITLSVGLLSIGHYAFSGCAKLTEVSLPNTVEDLGYRVFYHCTGLASVDLPLNWKTCLECNSWYYGHAFEGCTALTSIVVPEGMETLPAYAFDGCTNLLEVSLPSTLKTIGSYAFRDCTGITDITLPEGLTTIKDYAFQGSGLTEIHFPAGMRQIGTSSFAECSALEAVTMEEGMTDLGAYAFADNNALRSAQLADSVTALGYRLFYRDTALTEVNIPVSWSSCPEHSSWYYGHVFEGCTALTEIAVPEEISVLPKYAFQGCDYLEQIYLHEGITAIPAYAFEGCTALKSLEIPEKVTSIGMYAFGDCTSLSTLTIPASVKSLGDWALNNCTGLTAVELSAGLQTVGNYAFNGCIGLIEVALPDTVSSIGFRAFYNCERLETVHLPAGWTTCPEYGNWHYGHIFEGCAALVRLELPEGITAIPRNAFQNTANLRIVILPESLQGIGQYAFADCASLRAVWVDQKVTAIETNSFSNSKNLTIHGVADSYAQTYADTNGIPFSTLRLDGAEVNLSGTVTDAKGNALSGVFVTVYDVTDLYAFATAETDSEGNWSVLNLTSGHDYRVRYHSRFATFGESVVLNALSASVELAAEAEQVQPAASDTAAADFEYAATEGNFIEITKYNGTETAIVIPSAIDGYTVDAINTGAFKGNTTLQSVILPNTLTLIEKEAFANCTALTYVGFGKQTATIGEKAFSGCTALEEVTLSNAVATIGHLAFKDCTALQTVSLPDTVKAIGYRAFQNDTALTAMNIPLSWETCLEYSSWYYGHMFEGCTSLTDIIVPEGMITLPKYAFDGCTYLQNVSLPSTLKTIGSYAFRNCSGIAGITLPEGLTTIQDYAFHTSGLTEIHFPAGMRKIGTSSFAECSALETVTMEEGMTELGAYAFANNKALRSAQLADSVTALGYRLFYQDTALTEVNIPVSWNSCPEHSSWYYGHAFEGCTALKEITVPAGIGELPKYAFQGCDYLEQIYLPEEITYLPSYAFQGCTSLKSLEIPAGVETIGNYALAECTSLLTLTIPDQVEELGDYALLGCTSLVEIDLSANLQIVGSYAFENCSCLTEIVLPDTVYSMGYRVFYNCKRLENVTLSAGWTECPEFSSWYYGRIFEGCTELKRLVIPEGATTLPRHALELSPSLRTVILPSSLKTIEELALAECGALELLWIDANTTDIADDAMENCGLLTIHGYYETTAETYATEHNIPFIGGSLDDYFVGLAGRVVDENGNGIAGISVSVYRVEGLVPIAQLTTDEQGNWNLEEAEKNQTYQIRYHSPYYTFEKARLQMIMQGDSAVLPAVVAEALDYVQTETPAADFEYAATDGNFIEITKYNGTETAIVIPSEIDGYTVDAINTGAFKGNTTLQSVILPDTLTLIEKEAFANCIALTYVGFGKLVTTIGEKAFSGCTSLEEVILSNAVATVGHLSFKDCTALQTVSLPDTVTGIGYRAFQNDTALTTVNIPLSWETCLEYSSWYYGHAFEGCTSLTDIIVPEGMITLPKYAFDGCTYLQNVSLPSTLKTIGDFAFRDCSGIAGITLPEGLTTIKDYAFQTSGLTEIHFPAGMRKIGTSSFAECSALEAVTMEEGMTELGAYAFAENKALRSAQLADSVTALGYRLFYQDTALTEVNIPVSWNSCPEHSSWYYGHAFEGCTALTEISVPEGLAALPKYAFQGCTSLEKITLPNGITAIPDYAFDGCTALKSLKIPDSVEHIGRYAFMDCINLSRLDLPAGVQTLGERAMEGCSGLTEVTLSVDLETIGAYAFSGCSGLTEIVMQDKVSSIGYRAFYNCTRLAAVTMSAAWERCPEYSSNAYGHLFDGCPALTRLDIPEGVTTIPNYAFAENSALLTVTLPKTIASIGNYAFSDCVNLGGVDLGNVKTIGNYAFRNCTNLEDMILSDDLRSVGNYAFYNCSALTFNDLPPRINSIGDYAFYGTKVKELTIPMGVTSLKQYVFANCSELTKVTLRRSVTSIHDKAFNNSPNVFFYCYNGSAAHTYAVKHSIPYELLPEPAANGSSLGNGKYVTVTGTDANGNPVSFKLYIYEYGTLEPLSGVAYSLEKGTLTMEMDGYYPVKIENCSLVFGLNNRVAMVPEKTESFIEAVHCSGKDALAANITIDKDSGPFTVTVYSSVSDNLVKKYQLMQDGAVLISNTTGVFKVDPSKVVPDKALSVRIIHAIEDTCTKLKTNIKVVEEAPKWDGDLSLGEKISFGVPSDIPLIGGGKVDIDFSVLPVYFVLEGNTFRAGIGCKQDLLKNEGSFMNFKKFISDQDESLQKGLASYLGAKEFGAATLPGSKGVDLEVYGFLEGTWDNSGNFTDVSGNVMIKLTGSYKKEWQTVVYVVPVVLKFKAEAGVETVLGLGFDVENAQFYFNGKLVLTVPEITVSGGVGIAYVADVSAYGSGKNEISYATTDGYLTAKLAGEIGVSAKLLFASYKKALLKGEWIYYHSGAASYTAASLPESDPFALMALDAGQYQTDRSYVARQSEWLAASKDDIALFAANDVGLGESQTLQTSVFYSADPQLMITDSGLQMMVWNGDAPERETGTHTAVMYSVYDNESETWSAPAIVEDDGTADFSVQAATDGEKIYLVWIDNARKDLTGEESLGEISAANRITAAVYTPETGFALHSLGNDIRSALLPDIAVVGDDVYIAWLENSEDDPLTLMGTNTISYAAFADDGWEKSVYVSCDKPVLSLALGQLNGQAAIAYTLEADGDLTTEGDIELYGGYAAGSAQKLTDNEVMEQNPQFASINGADALVWYADGDLYAAEDFTASQELTSSAEISADYQVINWNGQTMLVCAVGQSNSTELQISAISGDTIGYPVALYDSDQYVSSFAVTENGDQLMIPYTTVYANITAETVHETTDLCLMRVEPTYDTRLDKIVAEQNAVQDGATLPVELTVTNTGILPVSKIKVTAKRGGVTKKTTDFEQPLAPGESTVLKFELPLEKDVAAKTQYTFTVKTTDGTERKDDNTDTLVVGYADLELKAETVQSGDCEKVLVTVENVGCIDSDATLRVRRDNASGEVLGEYYVGKIAALGSETMHLDASVLPELSEGEHLLYFEAFALEDEYYFSNNNDFTYLSGGSPALTVNLTVNETVYNVPTELTGNCMTYAAVYDTDGKMLAVSDVQRMSLNATVDLKITLEKLPETYRVKLFFLDGSYRPLTDAVELDSK